MLGVLLMPWLLSSETVLSSLVLLMLELVVILSLEIVLSSLVRLLLESCILIPMRKACPFIIVHGAVLVFLSFKILLNSSQSFSCNRQ